MAAPVFRSALVMLLALGCISCTPQERLPYKNYPRPSIPATRFIEGADGARCMADALRATALASNVRVDTFQDFDVAFPVLEYRVGPQTVRVIVVSTDPAIAWRRGLLENIRNRDGETDIETVMRIELQIRQLEDVRYYFYGAGADLLLPRMGPIWEASCKAQMTAPPSLGPRDHVPPDFAGTGHLDFDSLLPFFHPAPLTPVDIR